MENVLEINNLKEVHKFAQNIPGWLHKSEGRLLYKLAKKAPYDIVEIGSYKGRSSIYLAAGASLGNNARVCCIDHHTGNAEHEIKEDTYNEFIKNITKNGLMEKVYPFRMTSNAASIFFVDNSIDLIFIDGSHDYDSVSSDFFLWFPKLRVGGVMVFHDTTWPGPGRLVKENMFHSTLFWKIGWRFSTTYGIKCEKRSFLGFIENLIKGKIKFLIHDPLLSLAIKIKNLLCLKKN